MSQHLKADDVRTVCGIALDVLDHKVGGVVEILEDTTCEWCIAESQQQGSDMAAPEPLANTDAANPPEAIEDKLRQILYKLWKEDGDWKPAIDQIQALITTETTKARIDELEALKQNTWSTDKCWDEMNERLDKLHALQKEQS